MICYIPKCHSTFSFRLEECVWLIVLRRIMFQLFNVIQSNCTWVMQKWFVFLTRLFLSSNASHLKSLNHHHQSAFGTIIHKTAKNYGDVLRTLAFKNRYRHLCTRHGCIRERMYSLIEESSSERKKARNKKKCYRSLIILLKHGESMVSLPLLSNRAAKVC